MCVALCVIVQQAIRSSHIYLHLYKEERQACQIIEDENKSLWCRARIVGTRKVQADGNITFMLRKIGGYITSSLVFPVVRQGGRLADKSY